MKKRIPLKSKYLTILVGYFALQIAWSRVYNRPHISIKSSCHAACGQYKRKLQGRRKGFFAGASLTKRAHRSVKI